MATTIQTIETPKKYRALDTSGNNNHGQIYSGRALEFDGVTDYLAVTGSDEERANTLYGSFPRTFACWIKFNDVTSVEYVIAGGLLSNASITMHDGYIGSASTVSGDNDVKVNTTVQANTWYRLVVVSNVDVTDASAISTAYAAAFSNFDIYINGIKQTLEAGNSYRSSERFILGARIHSSTVAYYFDGNMSDVQAWDTAWSAADVTYDYLNPESLALNASGTSLTESNLKLWYPMQDGHRGQQSYILDGANTGLGDEMITNGDFSSGSTGWTLGTDGTTNNTWTVADGKAIHTDVGPSDGSSSNVIALTQSVTLVAGVQYKLNFDFAADTSGRFGIIGSGGQLYSYVTYNTDENVTIYFTTSGAHTTIAFTASQIALTFSLDNISLKPVNDKNHATTVFYGDELISNGGFETNVTGWSDINGSLASGPTQNSSHAKVGAESLSFVANAAEEGLLASFTTVTGRTYKVDFWVKPLTSETKVRLLLSEGDGSGWITASDLTLSSYSTATGTVGSGNWYNITYEYVEASGGSSATIRIASASDDADGTFAIDEVSIKEVGLASGWTDADQQLHIPQTALQSYNQLAWFDGVADYTSIADDVAGTHSFGDGSDDDPFSISAWIYMNDATNFLVASKGVTGSTLEWGFGCDSNDKIFFYQYDQSASTYIGRISSSAITAREGEWIHVVGTYPGDESTSNGKLYLNGEELADTNYSSGTYAAMENLGGAVHIGRYNTLYSNGSITETSIWADELSQAEINELYNDGKALDATTHSAVANLSGYWRNDGLSTWSNLDNPGTLDGTPTSMTETLLLPAGVDATRDNQGFIMNRQRDTSILNLTNNTVKEYVDLGSVTTIAADDTASLVMWIKPDDLADNNFLTSGGTDYFRIQSATILDFVADGATGLDFVVGTITVGEWIHIALVKAGGGSEEMSVYINGVQNGSATAIGLTSNEPFDYRYIGSLGSNSGGFRGQMDGFLVYSDVLTQAEVERNYNATKGNHRN